MTYWNGLLSPVFTDRFEISKTKIISNRETKRSSDTWLEIQKTGLIILLHFNVKYHGIWETNLRAASVVIVLVDDKILKILGYHVWTLNLLCFYTMVSLREIAFISAYGITDAFTFAIILLNKPNICIAIVTKRILGKLLHEIMMTFILLEIRHFELWMAWLSSIGSLENRNFIFNFK